MLLSATLQSTSLGSKLVLDATSMADVREQELGEQSQLQSCLERIPEKLCDVSSADFDGMFPGSLSNYWILSYVYSNMFFLGFYQTLL